MIRMPKVSGRTVSYALITGAILGACSGMGSAFAASLPNTPVIPQTISQQTLPIMPTVTGYNEYGSSTLDKVSGGFEWSVIPKADIGLNGLWAFNGNITVSVLDPYTRSWVYDETLSISADAYVPPNDGPYVSDFEPATFAQGLAYRAIVSIGRGTSVPYA